MANRYANLPGASKISQSYQLINEGFDKVEQEMDAKPNASIAQVNEIEMAADDTLTLEAGVGIDIVPVPAEKKLRIVATGTATPGKHGSEHGQHGSDPIPELVQLEQTVATHLADYASHKEKLVTSVDGVHGLRIEYGTFAPSLKGATVEGEHTYSFRWGEYYRIGRLVAFILGFRLSAKDPAMEGTAQIHGLPFVRGGTTNNFETLSVVYANVAVSSPYQDVGALVVGTSSYINLIKMGPSTNFAELPASDITNTTEIRIAGKYLTN